MEVDIIVCDIITNFMSLDPSRIVIYNQNWVQPTDSELFIVVSTGNVKNLSEVEKYDADTDEMISYLTMYKEIKIDSYSKNESAKLRNHEIQMAINSTYSLRQQEDNNIKIFRNGDTLDLSFIDGSSSLHRYRTPIIITYVEVKRTAIEPIDKFQPTEVLEDG